MSLETRQMEATGFVHEALLYDCDDDLLSVMEAFVEDAAAAGEPVLLALSARSADLVRPVLPEAGSVTFLADAKGYRRPASTVRLLSDRFRAHAGRGSGRMRVVGEVLDPSLSTPWEPWARYEAAINDLYAGFPVWGLCPYDIRTTPDEVLADVQRTHPRLATPDGRHPDSDRYEDPVAFLAGRHQPAPDPVERTGVSEAVTNAHLHGRPPIRMRAWAVPDRLVVTIGDAGPGPTNPFAGLVPSNEDVGGLGLWMTHQLCSHVAHIKADDGFTIRLTAEAPRG